MCVRVCVRTHPVYCTCPVGSLSDVQLKWMQKSYFERRTVFRAPLPVDWVLSPTRCSRWSGSRAKGRGGGGDRHKDEKEGDSKQQ